MSVCRTAKLHRQWPRKAAGGPHHRQPRPGPRNRRTSQRAAAGAQAVGRSQCRRCARQLAGDLKGGSAHAGGRPGARARRGIVAKAVTSRAPAGTSERSRELSRAGGAEVLRSAPIGRSGPIGTSAASAPVRSRNTTRQKGEGDLGERGGQTTGRRLGPNGPDLNWRWGPPTAAHATTRGPLADCDATEGRRGCRRGRRWRRCA